MKQLRKFLKGAGVLSVVASIATDVEAVNEEDDRIALIDHGLKTLAKQRGLDLADLSEDELIALLEEIVSPPPIDPGLPDSEQEEEARDRCLSPTGLDASEGSSSCR
jgi:hypothetical protein